MAITEVRMAPVGADDVEFDIEGTGATFVKETSDGSFKQDEKLNASHLPVSTTVRGRTYADNTATPTTEGDLDVDSVLDKVLVDLTAIGVPDGSTIVNTAGTTAVPTDGITATQIAAGAVDTSELAADAVDGTKIEDDAVDSEHIAAGAIDNEHLAVDIVGANELNMDGAGAAPSHFILDAGAHTASGGATTEVISTTATIASTDLIFVTFRTNNATVKNIVSAIRTGANAITVTGSANFVASDVIVWQVIKTVTAI